MLDRLVRKYLAEKKIVLASSSPSRKDIFDKNLKINVAIWPPTSNCDGIMRQAGENLDEYIENMAINKVMNVEAQLQQEGDNPDMIIGAHTVVLVDDKWAEKPTTRQEAKAMLHRLAALNDMDGDGVHNTVLTAVAIKSNDAGFPFTKIFIERTNVYFKKGITSEHIEMYVATGEPMNMAGAYSIQGVGSTLVERIDGDYYNVMGFPVCKFCNKLNEIFKNILCQNMPLTD